MATAHMNATETLEASPPLVLLLWDGFTGRGVMAGDIVVSIGVTKPRFQSGAGQFIFGALANGSYVVSVKSASAEPYYLPVYIPVTLPFPRPTDTLWSQPPVWTGYPDIVLADPDKTLNDPEQTAAYLGQRALATLTPSTAYPFPAGTTLLRGVITAAGVPLSGALVSTSPTAQPGEYSIVVLGPSGPSSATQKLIVVSTPVASSIDPTVVAAGGAAFTLTVEGSGFVQGAVVKWNATTLTTTFLDSSTLMAQVSASQVAAAASVTVSVANPDGTPSNSHTLTIAKAPSIVSVNPSGVTPGSAGFTLSVMGSGFAPGAVVQLKSTSLATTWLSSTSLQAQVPAGQLVSAAQLNVTVKNPGAKAQSSNAQVLAVATTPVINSLEPSAMVTGSAAFTLRVTGSGFVSGSVAQLGGAALSTAFQNENQLTAQVTAPQIATAESLNITILNPDGTTSDGQSLVVEDAPTITSLQPTSLAGGSTAFSLVVRGTGFVSGSSIELNGARLSTTFVNSTELDAHVPQSGYTTGVDGTFVLFFDDVAGLSEARTVFVVHPSYPNAKLLDVTLLRGTTVSASTDMSS